ncbi:serine protease 3-like [Sitodiplosis mosellana]|uniref:serine protease 3-like n=1 Tax=Sitodiplosis mosellana TaxID=263140 RepID=UPI002443F84C|nr:serine protease 3-like [Sitodiplosis mosellana]
MNLLQGWFSVLFIVEFSEFQGKHGFFSQALLKGEVIETMSQAKFVAGIQVPTNHPNDANTKMMNVCTAFILSKTEIITNAHCVYDAPYVHVVAGTKVVSDANQKIKIKVEKENVAYHPYFSHLIFGAFDIAKITLKTPLKFSDTVGSIELVDKDYKLNNPSELVTAYGYGVLNNIRPLILRRCDANYMSDVERANTFNPSHILYFTTGEATNDGEIITGGDSGGPVVSKTNGKIVGITMGINGTTAGRGMFLPITLFLDFIRDPKSVKPIPPPLTPNEAKFIADITVPGKFLTAYKKDFADADENVQLKFHAIILSKTEILTCAHGVLGAPYVYVTVNKLSRNATQLKVTEDQIEIHEKYDALSGFAFDVAKCL